MPPGMLADFVELKRLLRAISEPLDHVFLNDIEPFTTLNPSAENIALVYLRKDAGGNQQENPVEVAEVKVWETDIQSATYRPVADKTRLLGPVSNEQAFAGDVGIDRIVPRRMEFSPSCDSISKFRKSRPPNSAKVCAPTRERCFVMEGTPT